MSIFFCVKKGNQLFKSLIHIPNIYSCVSKGFIISGSKFWTREVKWFLVHSESWKPISNHYFCNYISWNKYNNSPNPKVQCTLYKENLKQPLMEVFFQDVTKNFVINEFSFNLYLYWTKLTLHGEMPSWFCEARNNFDENYIMLL